MNVDDVAAYDDARLRVLAGLPVHAGPDTPPRLARALLLAASTGAPLEAAVSAARSAARHREEAARASRVATAQPRLVAAILVALPAALSAIVAVVTGVGPAEVLTHPVGRAAVAVGLVLLALGVVCILALLRRARRPTRDDGTVEDDEVIELVVAALEAGRPVGAALRDVAAQVPSRATSLRRAALAIERGEEARDPGWPGLAELVGVLRTAEAYGATAIGALHDLARRARDEQRAALLARVQRLPVLLTLPTALLLLPATVVLAGAPLLLDVLANAT